MDDFVFGQLFGNQRRTQRFMNVDNTQNLLVPKEPLINEELMNDPLFVVMFDEQLMEGFHYEMKLQSAQEVLAKIGGYATALFYICKILVILLCTMKINIKLISSFVSEAARDFELQSNCGASVNSSPRKKTKTSSSKDDIELMN